MPNTIESTLSPQVLDVEDGCKQQEKNSKRGSGKPFQPGESGNPAGRPKGSLNRTTMLKYAILDGIELAAKRKNQTPAEYIADMLETPDKMAVINAGVRMVPKAIKQENFERVVIITGPDEDCESE